jgi:hypothetical protein
MLQSAPVNDQPSPHRKRQVLYIIAPLFLLLACLGLINLTAFVEERPLPITPVPQTAVSTATPLIIEMDSTNQDSQVTVDNATPSAITPTPAATPLVTLSPPPPTTTIQLLGPPPDGTFSRSSTISFYWQWLPPLTEDQFFVLYLLADGQIIEAGTVNEANVGNNYRLHIPIGELVETADSLQWQIQLQASLTNTPLTTSETRQLFLIETNN